MTIRVGLIGVGRFGKHYARLLQEVGSFELAGVASRSRENLDVLALPSTVRKSLNPKDIFDDKSIDAIVIATPVQTHADLACAALDAGKHVLLEKPMATTYADAEKIARKTFSGKTFMVGHQYVYNDFVVKMRSLIDSRELGEVLYFFADHEFNQPKSYCGVWLDAGTHQLSVLQFLLGAKNLDYVSSIMQDGGIDNDHLVNVQVRVDYKVKAALRSWRCSPQRRRTFTVVCSKGTLFFDDYAKADKLFLIDNEGRQSLISISSKEPLRNELLHFSDCIRQGSEPLTGCKSSLQIACWLDKIGRNIYNAHSLPFPYGSS